MTTDYPKIYIVKAGDTPVSIAVMFYEDGNLWRLIAKANNLDVSQSLTPGTELTIPDPDQEDDTI